MTRRERLRRLALRRLHHKDQVALGVEWGWPSPGSLAREVLSAEGWRGKTERHQDYYDAMAKWESDRTFRDMQRRLNRPKENS